MTDNQHYSLPELLAVISAICLLLLATSAYYLPTLSTGSLESSVHDLHVAVQLARIEAVSRNRECRIEIDSNHHSVKIYDSLGTTGTADDQLLHQLDLPSSIQLTHPDSSVTFTAEGTVNTPTLIGVDHASRHGQILIQHTGTIRVDLS
jgi:Tfp pilus assembly protein FimT